MLAYDHVLGADPAVHQPLDRPYDVDTTFHEPFVLFGYLAALTSLELVTGDHHPAPAPDRARGQAGRRGRPAHRRAASGSASASAGTRSSTRRSARTSPTAAGGSTSRSSCCGGCGPSARVTHDGAYEQVTGAGLAPLPVQRPIPIWIGGASPRGATGASGRLADGWFPQVPPGPDARRGPRRSSREAAADAGRDPAAHRDGGPGQLDRPAASTSSSTRSSAGATPAPRTCDQHDERRAAPASTATSRRWPRPLSWCCDPPRGGVGDGQRRTAGDPRGGRAPRPRAGRGDRGQPGQGRP